MPIIIAMDIVGFWRYRNEWSWPVVNRLLPSAIIGLLCGALLFQYIDIDALTALVGLMALFLALSFAWRRFLPAATILWRAPLIHIAGFICGVAGVTAHAGGPAIKGYLLSQNMDKTGFVGTNTLFFLFLNAIKGGTYAAMSLYSVDSLKISLMLSPFLALGVLIGFRLHKFVRQSAFMIIAHLLLGLVGLRLVGPFVSGLL